MGRVVVSPAFRPALKAPLFCIVIAASLFPGRHIRSSGVVAVAAMSLWHRAVAGNNVGFIAMVIPDAGWWGNAGLVSRDCRILSG